MEVIKAYFDGSCLVNPGGAIGYGCIVSDISIWRGSHPNPINTNNIAEYRGLLLILKYLKHKQVKNTMIHIHGDSNMVINQMKGDWKIKRKGNYYNDAIEAKTLVQELIQQQQLQFYFQWIPREENSIADALSNKYYEQLST